MTTGVLEKNTTTITARISKEDKKMFEQFCFHTGMSVSTAINMFIKNTLYRQELPFSVKLDPFYSAQNISRLRKAKKDIENGNVTQHELIEVDDEQNLD
jgi:DNA-damage-inducible protein J